MPAPVANCLVIGTVQFGLPYGVTNTRGQVTLPFAREILSEAQAEGIEWVDTAASYGTSESLLGQCLPSLPGMGVITKTLAVSQENVDAAVIAKLQDGVTRSRELLGRSKLDALLLHHGGDLLKHGGDRIAEFLTEQKVSGIAEKIGVSVYDADEIDDVLKVFRPDVIQLPLNLFDQSLIKSGHIKMLRDARIEIHARSAFLQGALLAGISQLPVHFQKFEAHFGKYHGFLRETGLTPLQACLGFMIRYSGADRVVVGVTSRDELAEVVAALPQKGSLPPMDSLASLDSQLTDPRRWPPAAVTRAATS